MSNVLSQTIDAMQRLLDRRDATIAQQRDRIAGLEQRCEQLTTELASLRASVVAALSSAGPEVGEDERAG